MARLPVPGLKKSEFKKGEHVTVSRKNEGGKEYIGEIINHFHNADGKVCYNVVYYKDGKWGVWPALVDELRQHGTEDVRWRLDKLGH